MSKEDIKNLKSIFDEKSEKKNVEQFIKRLFKKEK